MASRLPWRWIMIIIFVCSGWWWRRHKVFNHKACYFASILTIIYLARHIGTTRTPAFWGYPTPPHDYPYHWVILDPKSKGDKVKVTNLKNSPKFPNFWISKRALHATHLLKLLDDMCKYEMDPMGIVEDTERTRFCPQADRRTDGQGDTSIPPFQLRWSGAIMIWFSLVIGLLPSVNLFDKCISNDESITSHSKISPGT